MRTRNANAQNVNSVGVGSGEIETNEEIAAAINNPKANNNPRAMDLEEKRVQRGQSWQSEKQQGKKKNECPSLHQRVHQIAWHIPWYAFKTQARLAQDSGVSPAAISRLIRGESQPSLSIALRVTCALSRRLCHPLDVREVFSLDGTYPTPSVCILTGCRNCLPPTAYESDDRMKAEFEGVKAGQWSMSTFVPSEVHEA